MPFNFNADHIAAQSGGFEPQRLNHFTIQFAGLGSADVIESSLLNFQMPTSEIQEVVIPYGNEDRKVAGKATVSEMSLTIVDYVDKDTWGAFNEWKNQVYNARSGEIGWAKDYKREGTVTLYGPKGEKTRRWKCIGCWPRSITPEQFTQESAERNNLTVALSCDKVLPESQQ